MTRNRVDWDRRFGIRFGIRDELWDFKQLSTSLGPAFPGTDSSSKIFCKSRPSSVGIYAKIIMSKARKNNFGLVGTQGLSVLS